MSHDNSLRSIAGLILASGMSRRFGASNKLLARVRGETVIALTVRAYVAAGLNNVLVVVGHQAEAVSAALTDFPIQIVVNPYFEEGQSRALIAGVKALDASVDAAIIGVGDQPFLSGGVIRRLADEYRATGARLLVPRYAGQRGNPALFDRALFPELLETQGDVGGRTVLDHHRNEVVCLDFADSSPALDIDTPSDLEAIVRDYLPSGMDSNTTAMPCPPPMHAEATPNRPPRRCSS